MSKAMDDALLRACAIVLLVLFASGGISSTVSAQTQPVTAVGNTAGRYSVSATSQATYSIPLWTPPGVNGVEPNLSLVYSSSRSPAV